MGNSKFSGIVKAVAGGYLIYLAVSMIQRFRQQGELSEEVPSWTLIPAVIFLIVGAFLIITFLKALTEAQKKEWEEMKREREEMEANKVAESKNYSATSLTMTQITQYNSSTEDSDTEDSDDDDNN